MKNYIKPELRIDNIFANVTVATDAFSFNLLEDKSGGPEVEISVPGGWWDD